MSSFYSLLFINYLHYVDKGVDDVKIDLEKKKVFVTSSTLNKDEIFEAIKKAGKETTFVQESDA